MIYLYFGKIYRNTSKGEKIISRGIENSLPILLCYACFEDPDVFERTVVLVGLNAFDALHDGHAFYDFAKDGVGTVEPGCRLASDDVKLLAGAFLLGIDIVAFACCGKDSATMDDLGHTKFRFEPFVGFVGTFAQKIAGLGGLGNRVSALNHEIADDAVKEHAVIGVLLDLLDEIVTVDGRLIVENKDYLALGRCQRDLGTALGAGSGGCQKNEEKKE